MASLKDLKDRISSVKSTQKITKAMQMVAAAKLRKAQEAVEAARPYNERLTTIIDTVLSDVSSSDLPKLLQPTNEANNYLILVCTAERGLCGGFNSHIVREAKTKINQLLALNKQVQIITIGKKGRDMLRADYEHLMLQHISLRDMKQSSYEQSLSISDIVLNMFDNQKFDVCLLAYSRFKNVMQQKPEIKQLIPAVLNEASANSSDVFEYEPNIEAILESLAKHNVKNQIFNVLLENVAGEMGAKMTAMDNASRNAGDMIDKLSVSYNRQRQAKITTELIEIIAGAEAL